MNILGFYLSTLNFLYWVRKSIAKSFTVIKFTCFVGGRSIINHSFMTEKWSPMEKQEHKILLWTEALPHTFLKSDDFKSWNSIVLSVSARTEYHTGSLVLHILIGFGRQERRL